MANAIATGTNGTYGNPYYNIDMAILIDKKGFKKVITHKELSSYNIKYGKLPPENIRIPYFESLKPFDYSEGSIVAHTVKASFYEFHLSKIENMNYKTIAIYEEIKF